MGQAASVVSAAFLFVADTARLCFVRAFGDRAITRPRSIGDYQRASEAVLAWKSLTNFYLNYAGDGLPVDVACAKTRSFFDSQELALVPRILRDVSLATTRTNIYGVLYDMPVFVAPTALHALVTPEGEVATANAAEATGAGYCFNFSLSSRRMSDVVAANLNPGTKWLHLYMHKDRRIVEGAIRLAALTRSFSAIIVTADHPHNRVQNLMLPRLVSNGAEIPTQFFKEFTPNIQLALGEEPQGLFDQQPDQNSAEMDPSVTWADIKWICSLTALPVVVKGVLRPEDAISAVKAGAKGVVVSNHGFRQIAGTIPAIVALPSIVAAVGSSIDVFVDSGIRRSTDVIKALALGAKAVLIGRPALWALSVGGQKSLEHMLLALKQDILEDLQSLGCKSLGEVDSSLLYKSQVYDR